MTLAAPPQPVRAATPPSAGGLSVADLAELIASFNEVTARLQGTHESLRSEVGRLEAELREAKDQLRRAQELAALGEMAAGIAHEVRNPLGSIRLYASALVSDLGDRPGERDLAAKIAGAVTRLDAVVSDVLNFSRRLVVRREEVCAADLIAQAVDACRDVLASADVTVHCPASASRSLRVSGDPLLLHQALVNVVRNAAEAIAEHQTPAPRAIHVDARRARGVTSGTGGHVGPMSVLRVRDTGPGIPPDVLSRVFNPFFTTRHTGTGLGLAIVHRIIDAHGGRVVIRNSTSSAGTPERGTTVEFLLPASAAASIPATSESAREPTRDQSEAA